jgi:hypothetical protein
MREKILEIIQENYNKFLGTTEAELHASVEIEALFEKKLAFEKEKFNECYEAYWIDQLKGLVEDLGQVHPEYIIERLKDEISSLEHGI